MFNTLEARADAAYARQLIADCCLALGDIDGAASERRTAQAALEGCLVERARATGSAEHVFTKLGVNSRASATGYAFDRKLV